MDERYCFPFSLRLLQDENVNLIIGLIMAVINRKRPYKYYSHSWKCNRKKKGNEIANLKEIDWAGLLLSMKTAPVQMRRRRN